MIRANEIQKDLAKKLLQVAAQLSAAALTQSLPADAGLPSTGRFEVHVVDLLGASPRITTVYILDEREITYGVYDMNPIMPDKLN